MGQAAYSTSGAVSGAPQVYTTVAYNTTTGAQQWAKHYDGPAQNVNAAVSMAVSSGTGTVFVTGISDGGPATGFDYATIAYAGTPG